MPAVVHGGVERAVGGWLGVVLLLFLWPNVARMPVPGRSCGAIIAVTLRSFRP